MAAAFVAATPAVGELARLPSQPAGVPWPTETWATGPVPAGTDVSGLQEALRLAFAKTIPGLGETRAIVIVAGGKLVAEEYAEGFGPDTRLPSWSMAKSITQALVGVAVMQGPVDIGRPMGNPRWPADDPRADIPWRQWLNMVDGQRYVELNASGPTRNDVAKMLFGEGRLDAAAFAAGLPSRPNNPANSGTTTARGSSSFAMR